MFVDHDTSSATGALHTGTPGTGGLRTGVPPTGATVRGRTGRLGLGLAGVVLGLGMLTACSSGAPTGTAAAGTTAASGSAGTSGSAAAGTTENTAFDQCMSANGVTRPTGGGNGGAPPSGRPAPPAQDGTAGAKGGTPQAPPGVDAAAWQKALAACASVAGAPPSS